MSIIIKSGATSDLLTIDPTSKAARISVYDKDGTYVGQKATYAVTAQFTAPAGTAPFFTLYGSASKTVRVLRVTYQATVATTAVAGFIQLSNRSTTASGGTSTLLSGTPLDSNDPASTATNIRSYTVAPTAGTLIGVIEMRRTPLAVTAATAASEHIAYDFRANENRPIVLRGVNEGIDLSYQATTTNATAVIVTVLFTEE